MDEEESYWLELDQSADIYEVTEYDYLEDWINAGYLFTMNRIISNLYGGKKRVDY